MVAKDNEYWQSVIRETQEALGELRDEKEAREEELETLKNRIVHLERGLIGLSAFADAAEDVPGVVRVEGVASLSLADACRAVLQLSNTYRTARGVRDSLEASGYELKKQHNNPLASIHGVIKRLVESGAVEEVITEGKARYRWKDREGLVAMSKLFGAKKKD